MIASCQALAQTLHHQMYHGEPLRVHVDTRDLGGGIKKWEWIKKGVPIRIEIGPRDIETRKICVQRRDQAVATKDFPVKEDFIRSAVETLDQIHHNLLDRATAFRNANITPCDSLDAFHAHWAAENPGWLLTPWAGLQTAQDHHPLHPARFGPAATNRRRQVFSNRQGDRRPRVVGAELLRVASVAAVCDRRTFSAKRSCSHETGDGHRPPPQPSPLSQFRHQARLRWHLCHI